MFKISEYALLQMRGYVQGDQVKAEAGGVLLGRYILGTTDVVVDLVTVPMQGDRRSTYHFFRKANRHQAIIDQHWTQSMHRCNYLGGWHTHPEPIPNPSGVDTRDWKCTLRRDQFDSETLYFIIVGTKELRVWEGDRHIFKIKELVPIINQEG
jgi:integrative and conjugative element protein (TIGR02256 family)